MGLYVLEVAFWILGIRGHIPRFDDGRPFRPMPSSTDHSGTLLRTLALIVVPVAVVALSLWAAVWLSINLR
jgi:hypothetical protein